MSKARDLADGTFSGAFSADSPTLVVDDANNRVGLGTAAPSAPLQIAADTNTLSLRISGRSSDDRSDVEFYENDNTTKLTGFTNEPGYSLWSYGTRSIYTDSDAHIFRNGSATTLARLDSDGLKFNGDTAAANALDDYEKGTWTPTIAGGTTAGTASYSERHGRYVKVGSLVHVSFYIFGTWSSAPSGIISITGLPFTVQNYNTYPSICGSMGYVTSGYEGKIYTYAVTNSTELLHGVISTTSLGGAFFSTHMSTSAFQMHLGITYQTS